MRKIYTDELVTELAGKLGTDPAAVKQALKVLVETIHKGIGDDGIVKVKGLGTFKLTDVEARESIDVNTGQRFTIDSHQKLTFTPDAAMKELVNRPFSAFETVTLNDGVEL